MARYTLRANNTEISRYLSTNARHATRVPTHVHVLRRRYQKAHNSRVYERSPRPSPALRRLEVSDPDLSSGHDELAHVTSAGLASLPIHPECVIERVALYEEMRAQIERRQEGVREHEAVLRAIELAELQASQPPHRERRGSQPLVYSTAQLHSE